MVRGEFVPGGVEPKPLPKLEPNPELDIEGWDTACKLLILANEWMHAGASLQDVARIGIGRETEQLIAEARASGRVQVQAGDNVWVNADVLMTHDVCGPGTIGVFYEQFGKNAKVWDSSCVVIIPDHYIFTADEKCHRNVQTLRDFVKQQGIKIEKIAKDGAGDEYLEKVREQLRREHETDLKENSWWLDELHDAYYFGDDFGKATDLDAIAKRVTSANVKATAKKFFTPNNVILGVMKPKKP